MSDATQKDLVVRFYMSAPGSTDESAREFVDAVRPAPEEEVIALVGDSGWREQRVGAWMALVHPSPAVVSATLSGVLSARAWYGLPYLAVAAYELAGADAIPTFETFLAEVTPWEPQSTAFVAHLLALLREQPSEADEATVENFAVWDAAATRIVAAAAA